MIKIKSGYDLLIARNWLSNEMYQLACREFENIIRVVTNYKPEKDGYLLIITSSTADFYAEEYFGCNWKDIQWDGITYNTDAGAFVAIKVINNQFVYTVLIPNIPFTEITLPGLCHTLEEALC